MTDTTRQQPNVTLAGARAAIDAALARADEIGVRVVIAVADRAGRLVAFARMDDSLVLSVDVAQKKATSVILGNGMPTSELWEIFGSDPELLHGLAPKLDNLMPVGGAVPILVGGELAGAVGVSGATAAEDEDVATAGAGAVSP